jgi:hypothetical protein
MSDSKTPLVVYTSTGYPCPQIYDPDNTRGRWCVRYDIDNVGLDSSDNSLTLTVPGCQSPVLAHSAKIGTNWKAILYGSVRTVAKTSNVNGTVHGALFYHNDTQETDIEIVTANPNLVLWTNQYTHPDPNNSKDPVTYKSAIQDSWTTYHEYRLDWLPGKTQFYIYGVLKQTTTVDGEFPDHCDYSRKPRIHNGGQNEHDSRKSIYTVAIFTSIGDTMLYYYD